MGVLVFILAILPMKGGSVMNLMKAESPGPSVSKFVPRVRGTAKILYQIYIVMTIVRSGGHRRIFNSEQRMRNLHAGTAVDSDHRNDPVRCEF